MQIIEISNLEQAAEEIAKIGCDPAGTAIMKDKAVSRAIKLTRISVKAALILKQEMLSIGGDAVNHRETISGKIVSTDVLLLGTLAHYRKLTDSLKRQPFGLPALGEAIASTLSRYETAPPSLRFPNGTSMDFASSARIMGILNCTPDSFSDGGKNMALQDAVAHGQRLIAEGADILDIGGESSRPGARPVSVEEELQRVIPVIEALSALPHLDSRVRGNDRLISVDTYRAEVARQALSAGAQMINDITALNGDPEMAAVVASAGCPVVLMHMQGTPQTMQAEPHYEDLIGELLDFFEARIRVAIDAGIEESQIIIDPGIGFGKTVAHNLTILKHLARLRSLGRPILLGASRKSVIGNVLNLPVESRLEGSLATVCFGVANGANIVRVHDVKETVRAVRMVEAIRNRD